MVIACTALGSHLAAKINFDSRFSTIKLRDGSVLNISSPIVSIDGSLEKPSGAAVVGQPVFFDNGILESAGAHALLTGFYEGASDTIFLRGNHSFDAEPGSFVESILVRGPNNMIEGQPVFNNDIVLNDPSTELTVALQNKVNNNIVLNNGTVILNDDLRFGDDVRVTESGTVIFNGNQLSLGGTDLIWSGTILWDHATDMVLNSNVDVVGQWIFLGDAHVIGNGNLLDLTSGGTIWIKHDSIVDFSDIKIRGLGSGSIIFENGTSQLGLSQVEIEMDKDYTVTIGGIYAHGPTNIVIKDKILTFEQQGSLTVDGIALTYDTVLFDDQLNIRPNIPDDLPQSHIIYLNHGVIRRLPVQQALGDMHLTINSILTDLLILSPYKRLFFDESVTLDGKTFPILFTRADIPLLLVADGKIATLTNIVLKDFSPDYVSYGLDSQLIFDDKTTIELGKNEDLNTTWTFEGACVLNGKGQSLNLDTLGEIVIHGTGSSLLIDNITITGLLANKIRCFDDTCTITFKNVHVILEDTYSFTTGHFEVVGNLDISGSYTFEYGADRPSVITKDSRMLIDNGTTFFYAPTIEDRDLIVMEDVSAQFYMQGGTVESTTTGMRLIRGTLIIDQKNFIRNDGATSISEGVSFGNGNGADDLTIKMMPAANIEVLSGYLDYHNVN